MTEERTQYKAGLDLVGIMARLREPFAVEDVSWKPQATKGDRALAIAYADARAYQERLDAVVGGDWSDDCEVTGGGTVVVCKLTVCGVTRCDVGEEEQGDPNTATSAYSQAFKRACCKFGLGRYLYGLPRAWVPYDPQRKRITDAGLAQLRNSLTAQRKAKAPQEKPAVKEAEPQVAKKWPARPWDAPTLKRALAKKANEYKGKDGPPSEKQLDYCRSSLGKLKLEEPDRHDLTSYLFEQVSTGDLTAAQCSAIIDWVGAKPPDYKVSQDAFVEARAILKRGNSHTYEDESGGEELWS